MRVGQVGEQMLDILAAVANQQYFRLGCQSGSDPELNPHGSAVAQFFC
jgi:hypothetical protein